MSRIERPSTASWDSAGRSSRYSYPTFGTAAQQTQERIPRQPRPDPHFDVLGGHREQTVRENNTALILGAVLALALLVFTIVCITRVALVNATVSVELETQAVSTELAENRSEASVLEVQDTMLSSATRVKSAATELEMAAPASVDQIYLTDDVVATNADGSLSFNESVKRATTASAEE